MIFPPSNEICLLEIQYKLDKESTHREFISNDLPFKYSMLRFIETNKASYVNLENLTDEVKNDSEKLTSFLLDNIKDKLILKIKVNKKEIFSALFWPKEA
jgi:hypothetical protein